MLADALARLDRALGRCTGDPHAAIHRRRARRRGGDRRRPPCSSSKDFAPYGRRRDAAVAVGVAGRRPAPARRRLAVRGRAGHGVKTGGQPVSRVHSVRPQLAQRRLGRAPARRRPTADWIDARSRTRCRSARPIDGAPASTGSSGGPSSSTRALDDYPTARNRPDDRWHEPAVAGTCDSVSSIPRQLLTDLDLTDTAHRAFADELAWRDFYADVLFRQPESAWQNLDRRFDAMPVDTDAAASGTLRAMVRGDDRVPDRRRRHAPADPRAGCTTGCGWSPPASWSRICTCRGSGAPGTSCSTWSTAIWPRTTTDGSGRRAAAPTLRRTSGSSTPPPSSERFDPDGRVRPAGCRSWARRGYPGPIVDHAAERTEAWRGTSWCDVPDKPHCSGVGCPLLALGSLDCQACSTNARPQS